MYRPRVNCRRRCAHTNAIAAVALAIGMAVVVLGGLSSFSSSSKDLNVGIASARQRTGLRSFNPATSLHRTPSAFGHQKTAGPKSLFSPGRSTHEQVPKEGLFQVQRRKYKVFASRSNEGEWELKTKAVSLDVDQSVDLKEIKPVDLDVELEPHPHLRKGKIDRNGFRYVIMKNPVPAGRFEAHLQMHVGSIEEKDDECGVAHIVEHVTFLGSDKRSLLFGTGSESNAYTDFHHTVYHINCPKVAVGTSNLPPGTDLLPLAMNALREIAFEAKMLNTRIEKERLAVLSELSMMTNMDYRMTTQEICELHSETILPKRFPIGDEQTIRTVHPDVVREFYKRFYHSDRADLFIVGDVDLDETERLVKKTFEDVKPSPTYMARQAMKVGALAGFEDYTETIGKLGGEQFDPRNDWRIRPQVQHRFSSEHRTSEAKLPSIFTHEMISSLQLTLCSKWPVQPIRTKNDLRDFILGRLVVACLGWSLTSKVRPNPPLSGIEFDHSDSMSEACAVTTLKVSSPPHEWKDMLQVALKDVRRAYSRGFSQAELDCMVSSLLADARQAAGQAENIPSSDVVTSLIEAELLGHTFMDFQYYYDMLEEVVNTITLEDVNSKAREMLEFVAEYGGKDAPLPAAVLACTPQSTKAKFEPNAFKEELMKVKELEDEDLGEVRTIDQFVAPETLEYMHSLNPPKWVEVRSGEERVVDENTGIVQRRLSNGIRINYKRTGNQPNTITIAAVSPGGIARETVEKAAAVKLGVQTIMQGGSFGNFTREEVDLFSMRNLMNINFGVSLESITWDLVAPGETLDQLMQFLMLVYSDLRWHESAFKNAKSLFNSNFEAVEKSLEMCAADTLVKGVANSDLRFWGPPPEVVERLSLEDVKQELEAQLCTENLEINIVGDFDEEELEQSVLKHLGTIPKKEAPEPLWQKDILDIKPDPARQHQRVQLPDDQKRAIGYLTGSAPNRYGYSVDHKDAIKKEGGFWSFGAKSLDEKTKKRRGHPLFASAVTELIEKMVSTELYTTLRDTLSLVYHTKFEVGLNERIPNNDWLVVINSEHQNVDTAVNEAAKCLRNMRFSQHSLQSAKRSIIHNHETDSANDPYWVNLMRGLQDDTLPDKRLEDVADYLDLIADITIDDVREMWKIFSVGEKEMQTCIGVSG